MRPEARAEKLGNEALDAELAEDWTTAAEKWCAAALASKGRKKEYAERARQASARTDTPPAEVEEKPAPEPPPFALRHMEAAGEAEGLGDFKLASVEWEMAASRMRGPEKDAALARAEQMRQMVKPEVIELPPITVGQTMRMMDGGLGVVVDVHEATSALCGPVFHADEMAEQMAREGDALIAAKAAASRDPRLPAPGTITKKPFRAGGFVVVRFTAGPEVELLEVDAAHQALLGKPYASVSGLARAYCGRNTSGYEWLGLKGPPTVTVNFAPRPQDMTAQEFEARATEMRLRTGEATRGERPSPEGTTQAMKDLCAMYSAVPVANRPIIEEAREQLEHRGIDPDDDKNGYPPGPRIAQAAIGVTVRRVADLFAELAKILEDW